MRKTILERVFVSIERYPLIFGMVGCIAIVASLYWRTEFVGFFEPYAPYFKTVASLLAVPIAIGGFYFGFRAKRDMVRMNAKSNVRFQAHSKKLQELATDLTRKAAETARLETQVERSAIQLQEAEDEVRRQRDLVDRQQAQVSQAERNLAVVSNGNIWGSFAPAPFPEYQSWIEDPLGGKILTVGNLKGGVGKTTLAANLAGYISERHRDNLGGRVLLVDLDFQGSLSNLMMFAAGREEVPSRIENLFEPDSGLEKLVASVESLEPRFPTISLVPASYSFASAESQLLYQWLMKPGAGIDGRYRLAHCLLHPQVRRHFVAIIIDMPPRLTFGAVNALVASHHLIVPTTLDRLSAEAVRQFLGVVRSIKSELNLSLDLLGVVGTLSRASKLSPREDLAWSQVGEAAAAWGGAEYRFVRTIPRTADIAAVAGEDVAYLLQNKQKRDAVQAMFNQLGDEIWDRLHPDPKRAFESLDNPQETDA